MSVKLFKDILVQSGLEEVEVSGHFDPNSHEAVDMREDEEDGKILEVTEPGYKISGKILRPSKVVVGKSVKKEEKKESN